MARNDAVTTAAIVGAAGGVGATRLTVEVGATLARAGETVALLDAAYATQGLAGHVSGRIDTDVTEIVTSSSAVDADDLDEGLLDHPIGDELAGRLAVCPAHAPFERLAGAKTPEAAQTLAGLVETAAAEFDAVLVDTPPVAANQAVAAVDVAERIGVVTVPTPRGIDALQRTRGRLADVQAEPDLVVANRVPDGETVPDADRCVPSGDSAVASGTPAAADPATRLAPPVAAVTRELFDRDLDLEFETGIVESTRRRLQS